jgi:hypothetical protein
MRIRTLAPWTVAWAALTWTIAEYLGKHVENLDRVGMTVGSGVVAAVALVCFAVIVSK